MPDRALTPSDRRSIFLQCCAFVALLFGAKLWLIGTYGNATPFWDQWDAEAESLYKPYLNGTLTWATLFEPHNEHRIFTTRLLALVILYINKTWNPLLQMIINAALYIFMLLFGIRLLLKTMGRQYLPAILAFSFILFSIPYAWENTLAAFQSQFYFVLLFSLATIWLTVTQAPLSAKWWGGIACALLAFLSLASGVFALAAAAIVNLVFFLTGLRRTGKQLFSVVILSALFAIGIWLTPTIEGHMVFKATSFRQFYDAFVAVLGWPVMYNFIGALVRNAPALILTGIMIWKRPHARDLRWFLVALTIWAFGQALSIAYGRVLTSISSRYLDLFAVTVLINFACLIVLEKSALVGQRSRMRLATYAWVGIVLLTLGNYGGKHIPEELAIKRDTGREQEINTRNYLATGDFNFLKDKPRLYIPYPNPERLATILASPQLREILPANISYHGKPSAIVEVPVGAFIKDGYYQTTPKPIHSTWGSYTTQGDAAVGQATITYKSKISSGIVEVPVAGYPLNEGMKLEMEQAGQRTPMRIDSNPKESWGTARAKLYASEFSIHLTDSSNTTWVAVGPPAIISKLDQFSNWLLAQYHLILMAGIAIVILLFMESSFRKEQAKKHI